jgi:1-aminocyclopropane-1-carboxylate deaminase/D-cysteine desulfhydrase-like pyridoxal-dependent ACC family enzyme
MVPPEIAATSPPMRRCASQEKHLNPLFQHYPDLEPKLPYVTLAGWPTPVERLPGLERSTGASALYLKRDDTAGDRYGGNKLRKLEYLLAQAKQRGARRVLTFGAYGSNHALATAVHARALGLGSISMLVPQVPSTKACRNLLASHAAGAELHHYAGEHDISNAVRYQLARHEQRDGVAPVVVPGGGSSALGALGFVAAAFELRAQIAAGELPEPSRIYLPLGTTGTAAGLALGLRLAGIESTLVAVRVTHSNFGNQARMMRLIRETSALLHHTDSAITQVAAEECRVQIRHDFYGGEYARYTDASLDAVRRAYADDGIRLEGTYTGKAMAAMLADLESDAGHAGPVLFWNTYNSLPLSVDWRNYRALPQAFHRYFEQDTQALDAAMEGVFA